MCQTPVTSAPALPSDSRPEGSDPRGFLELTRFTSVDRSLQGFKAPTTGISAPRRPAPDLATVPHDVPHDGCEMKNPRVGHPTEVPFSKVVPDARRTARQLRSQ